VPSGTQSGVGAGYAGVGVGYPGVGVGAGYAGVGVGYPGVGVGVGVGDAFVPGSLVVERSVAFADGERLDSSMCTVTSTLRLMLMSLKLNGVADGVFEGAGVGAGVGGMGTTVTFGREMITT